MFDSYLYSMEEKFQIALNYALETQPVEQVVKDLIECMRQGWANKPKIDTPYLEMKEILWDGVIGNTLAS